MDQYENIEPEVVVTTSRTESQQANMKYQLLAACSANLNSFALGASLAWAAPSLPQLSQSSIGLDKTEISVVSSVINIGGLIGALTGGALMEKIGPRKTFLVTAPVFLCGFLFIGLAENFPMLVLGRILTGIAGGVTTITAPVYVGEIAVPKHRGLLGSMFSLLLVCGVLSTFILGAFLQWRNLTLISCTIPVLSLIFTIAFVPESPVYLLRRNDESGAKESLNRLYGPGGYAEFETLLKKGEGGGTVAPLRVMELCSKPVLKATSICLALMFFQQTCGVNAVFYNLKLIFEAAGGTIDSAVQVIIIGLVQLITTIAGSLIVDRAGRKLLLALSAFVVGISLIFLGIYFTLSEARSDFIKYICWLPLLCLVLYSIFFYIGLGPVTWTVMGEMLPPKGKGVTSAIVTCFSWASAFLVTLTYESLVEVLGQDGIFYCYGTFSLLGVLYIIFFVPETTGKTLAEIQKIFE